MGGSDGSRVVQTITWGWDGRETVVCTHHTTCGLRSDTFNYSHAACAACIVRVLCVPLAYILSLYSLEILIGLFQTCDARRHIRSDTQHTHTHAQGTNTQESQHEYSYTHTHTYRHARG